jgi:hypothetical protein
MKQLITTAAMLFIGLALIAFPVKITSWQIKDDVKKLNSLNVSVDYVNQETQTIIAYVPDDEGFQKVLANGFDAIRIPDLAKENAAKETRDGTRAYYTLEQYNTFMQNTATQYPSICQLVQFGTTVGNRPLYFMKISDNVTVQENEPEVRYVSSIHGDEVVGFEMCIRLIQLLTSQYGTNTRINNIVNNTEIWICPMLNPDGNAAVERYNGNGADINRNFPMAVGSQHPDGMAWQPETLAIMNHMNEHSLNLSATFHGGALVTNYLWDYTYALAPDNNLLIQGAHVYADTNLPMHNSSIFDNGITNGAEWYIVEGSISDWSYAYRDDIDYTIELSDNKWPPSSQLDTFWNQNQESMLALLEFVQKGAYGTVTNEQGQPLLATIHLNSNGIDILSDPDVGDYHRMLLPGTYTITAYATGYASVSAEVVVPTGGSIEHNFVLPAVAFTGFTGYVVKQQGGAIPNANVKLTMGTDMYQAQTDAQGFFTFDIIPSGTYTLSVYSTGYGTFSSSYQLNSNNNKQLITLAPALFYDGFNNGLTAWTVQAPWAIVNQSGNYVLTDSPSGNYANNITLSATMTNAVSFVNVTTPSLSFDIKYALEANYDYVFVQGSSNGFDWTNLTQFTGTNNNVWQTVTVALDAYLGMNFKVRFQITSDPNTPADGVYLDNVVISGMLSNQTVYGDIDANWLVNLNDVTDVLEYSVGHNPIPLIDTAPWETFRLEAADVDNDDQITATDAYYIYDKYTAYNGAFPSQAGAFLSFQNPNLTIENDMGILKVRLGNPQNLKSISLQFTAQSELSFQAYNWQVTGEQALIASSEANLSFSLVALPGAQIPALLVNIPYLTMDYVIHCTGLINDIPVNMDITITANGDAQIVPILTNLENNYPNPFNPVTTIRYSLSDKAGSASLIIYNVKGQAVKTLLNGVAKNGNYNVKWNGTDNHNRPLGNGVYYYRLTTSEQTITRKMVLLK